MTYIRLLFLPFGQNLDYDYAASYSLFELPTLLSFIFLVGILIPKHTAAHLIRNPPILEIAAE